MKSYSYLDMKSIKEGIEKAPERSFGVFVVKRLLCEEDDEYKERCEVLEDLKFLLAAPDMKTVRDFFDDIQEVPRMASNDMPKALREAKSRGVKKLLF